MSVDLNERGSVPKELLVLGVGQYRQLIVKPYRIIYQRMADQVCRNSMKTLPRIWCLDLRSRL